MIGSSHKDNYRLTNEDNDLFGLFKGRRIDATVAVDGARVVTEAVALFPIIFNPVWSPDGQRLIFENDSSDGSREVLKRWAAEENLGYRVDLMECSEAIA